MTGTEAIAGVYLKATGKTATLTSGSKYTKIIGLLGYYQRRWAREPNVDWNSLYDPAVSIGTVTATDTFELDTSTIRKISDREGDVVRIVWSDGVGYTDFDVVSIDALREKSLGASRENRSGNYCARNGGSLVFNHTFESDDSEFGGEIFVPCYIFPNELDADTLTEDVQVDDPDWLITRAAAEYVRTDLTRANQYPNLIAEANEIMERMKDDNEAQVTEVGKGWTAPGGLGDNGAWS